MRRAGYLIAGVLLMMCACRPGAAASGDTGRGIPNTVAIADTVATGTVHVTGAVPVTTVIVVSDSGSVALAGALTHELATLDGAQVRVTGKARPASPPLGRIHDAITVEQYRILCIAGKEPVVGILSVSGSGDFRIDTIPLSAPPAQFAKLVGGKIWVVGARQGAGPLLVTSYGVLVPPPE